MQLNTYIDHTLLAADASVNDIEKLCAEAINYNFYAVCVNSSRVKSAHTFLNNSEVKLAATIGFPLGSSTKDSKITEARNAIEDGADEIDMVLNIGYLKDGNHALVQDEISAVKKVIGNKTLKVILETGYLSDELIEKACDLSMKANADFVKTSTGFGSRGASLEDIHIMKNVVGEKLKIKASGGIKNAETAKRFIAAGVHRIGTSSGIRIMT